jgi:oxygen-independent coproporphyrinogen-3 oxidase
MGATRIADDDSLAEAYDRSVSMLESHGLQIYEISNFARASRVSRHNLKYWTDQWYGGFGLGAHSYARGRRRANRADLDGYLAALDAGRDPLVWEDPWDARRRLDEALIMGLRLARGLDTERLGQRYEVNLRQVYRAAWDRGAAAGLIRWNGPRVRLTRRGRICSNELFAELLAA